MHLAASEGYLRWLFRPIRGGVWDMLNEPDDTLDADGGRQPPCAVLPAPRRPDGRGRTVYRLGAVHRILLRRRNNLLQRAAFEPLEGGDGHLYFAFRQTLARLHEGILHGPRRSRIPLLVIL